MLQPVHIHHPKITREYANCVHPVFVGAFERAIYQSRRVLLLAWSAGSDRQVDLGTEWMFS